jgi:homoserine dehydrogenase
MDAIAHEDAVPTITGTPWWQRLANPKVEIVARYTFGTTVTVDDVEIRGIVNVEWAAPVNKSQRIVLTLAQKSGTTDPADIPGAVWVRKLEEPGHIAVTIFTNDVTVVQYDETEASP